MNTNTNTNILIVGVGGQGTLLAGKVIGVAALLSSLAVKQSEVHGMAQRGGSVVTHVRFGEAVFSPLIEQGQADIILAFEKLEALRWGEYLRPGGALIVNDQEILPMPVILGAAAYPADIDEQLKAQGLSPVFVDALALAGGLGEVRAVNVILLGIAAKLLPFSQAIWEEAVRQVVPDKALAVNLQAFRLGWEYQSS